MRLVAAGRGLHALLGLSSVPAPVYLGTNGSNLGGGCVGDVGAEVCPTVLHPGGGGAAGAKRVWSRG